MQRVCIAIEHEASAVIGVDLWLQGKWWRERERRGMTLQQQQQQDVVTLVPPLELFPVPYKLPADREAQSKS